MTIRRDADRFLAERAAAKERAKANGRKGGETVLTRYGREHYQEMGRRGQARRAVLRETPSGPCRATGRGLQAALTLDTIYGSCADGELDGGLPVQDKPGAADGLAAG